jgi:tetratricopeptide (TPR) repeat protein
VEPAVTSTLGATPLLHVLISLLSREATGTLVIDTTDGGRSSVFIEGGVPVKTSTSEPVCRLSELLVSLGTIDSQTAERSFDEAQELRGLHGEQLVNQHLLDEQTLDATLRTQLVTKLSWAAALPLDSEINLFENVDLLPTWPVGPLFDSPLETIWSLAKNHVDLKSVSAVLRQLVGRPLRLHPLSQTRWFGFDSQEQQVIECLADGVADMQTLMQNVAVPARTVQIMLYVLTITRHLDLGQRKPPIGFEISGSGQRKRVDVRTPIRPLEATNPQNVSEAPSTQSESVPPLPLEEDTLRNSAQSLNALQRAEYLLDRQKLDEAEAEAKLAIDYAPQQTEGLALYAWIQACKLGDGADLSKCLAILTDALEKDPVNEKLRFRRARLLSRLGHTREAMQEFRLIAELNPRHIDAQREIRLWDMRHGSKRADSGEFSRPPGPRVSERPPPVGLFGRLFRRQ